jgi:hypothetical protein
VSFAAITLCIAFQRVFLVIFVYFVIESVRKLLDTSSYSSLNKDRKCVCLAEVPYNKGLVWKSLALKSPEDDRTS